MFDFEMVDCIKLNDILCTICIIFIISLAIYYHYVTHELFKRTCVCLILLFLLVILAVSQFPLNVIKFCAAFVLFIMSVVLLLLI